MNIAQIYTKIAERDEVIRQLTEALVEVVTISDRDHVAWQRAKDALAKARELRP